MKKYAVLLLAIFALLITSNVAFSQSKKQQSEKGFWVLESNIHQKKNTIVHFYNDHATPIYNETITGKTLNVNRKKTLRFLNAGLEKAIIAWNKNKTEVKDGEMLAVMLGKKK